ncbi:MAG: hypothetical protein AB7P44_02205 [Steroidobacteraceae bacterium]
MHLAKKLGAVLAILAVLFVSARARAQTTPGPMDHAAHDTAAAHEKVIPTSPGQDAFGAIQEIVRILEADASTDWSRVNIDALREHLIDMNEVTLHATSRAEPIDGGLRILVTGTGRTLEAIRRMVPAHAREIDEQNSWSVTTEPVAEGIVLTATTADPMQVVKIRGLGFMGIMVRGAHHQPHHLAMARGVFPH